MTTPRFESDDQAAQHWLILLRDGDDEQKILAREQLAGIFDRRGMPAEAAELRTANGRAAAAAPAVPPARPQRRNRRTLRMVGLGCLGCGGLAVLGLVALVAIGAMLPKPPVAPTAVAVQPTIAPPAAAPPTVAPVPTVPASVPTAAAREPEPKPESKPADERSPEVLLAIIQHGGGIQPSDPRVVPFAQQLDKLEAKCTEDRSKLADLTAGANKVMADRGTTEPILNTISGVATASEGVTHEQACSDLFAAYATLRLAGSTGATPKPVAKPAEPAKPAPGSAIVCNDGSTWPSMTRQGACSRRGGIAPGY